MYRDSDYTDFTRPQCAQEPQNIQRTDNNYSLSSYSYNSLSVPMTNNVYNQSQGQQMYNTVYGNQGMYRNTNNSTINTSYVSQMEWDPCLTAVSISDKDKQIKLPLTQLSPASCCSSVDPLACSPLPDFFKTMNKDIYGKSMLDSQWFHGTSNYNTQKYSDFPSCSQMVSSNDDCNFKFCNVQKYSSEVDKLLNYSPNNVSYGQQTKVYNSCQVSQLDCSIYETFEDKQILNENSSCIALSDHDTFYSQNHVVCNENLPFEAIPNLDVGSELKEPDGGVESDIIVEETDEDIEDSDENDKEESHCIVCNTLNTPLGAQFFILTPESPLSMSSQRPVFKKLIDVIGQVTNQITHYLCSYCLALVNTIDHLESNLENTKLELLNKYKENFNISLNAMVNLEKTVKKPKFKHLCGMHSFKCRICNKKFSLKMLHQIHMAKHKTKYKFLCEHCGKCFVKHSTLIIHLKKHRNSKTTCKSITKFIKAFTCEICQKPFRTKSNLKEHELACKQQTPHECVRCNKKFITITQLNNHVRLKHVKDFMISCKFCSKGFVKQSDYKSHLLSHSNEKQFKCDICDKSYKTLSNLNHHIKFHQKMLPFICNICNKGFMRKEYMEAHMNFHNGLKPFSCTLCDKKFVSQKNLDAHLKTHTGSVKKKMCTVCGKEIIHGLAEHMRTHSNNKEFECGICFTKFNTKGALAKHTKRKHENFKTNDSIIENFETKDSIINS